MPTRTSYFLVVTLIYVISPTLAIWPDYGNVTDICHNSTDTIYGPEGQIKSPNYPYIYPPYQDCGLKIQAGHFNFIRITIEFKFQDWGDYLEIFDGPDQYAHRLTKLRNDDAVINDTVVEVESTYNSLYLRFYSDGWDQYGFNGFIASFKEVQGCGGIEWRCDNGQCISILSKCDGKYDCLDHSDEYCDIYTTTYPTTRQTATYTTARPSPKPSQCKDLKKTCVEWVYRGYCTNPEYETYMTVYCRKSCNMCTGAIAAMNNQGDPCIPVRCSHKHRPVCGSDGANYWNDCYLINARNCGEKVIMVKSFGNCTDTGGISPANITDPSVQKALHAATKWINMEYINSMYLFKVADTSFTVTQQVVAGMRYYFEGVNLAQTVCIKNNAWYDVTNCQVSPNGLSMTCSFDVIDQPWMTHEYTIMNISCDDLN